MTAVAVGYINNLPPCRDRGSLGGLQYKQQQLDVSVRLGSCTDVGWVSLLLRGVSHPAVVYEALRGTSGALLPKSTDGPSPVELGTIRRVRLVK